MKTVRKIITVFVLVAACGAIFSGCGQRYDTCEVEGILTCDGKPVPSTEVYFQPANGDRGGVSLTDANGHFVVRYTRDTVGIPPGQYKVFIGIQTKSKERDSIPDFKKILNKYSKENTPIEMTIDKKIKDLKIDLTLK
ncbi:MAG: carboxypeptidase-like regulatory domain-containing protein [Planctomycetia bacterium]|nr:carboxypeptidase-like regulatory domain-containing protein [Planctomycetia bacterium]